MLILNHITNDPLRGGDSELLTILILLDLSTSFDTISHTTLLDCLADTGITGAALCWFTSYLTDRQHFVQIRDHKSGCCQSWVHSSSSSTSSPWAQSSIIMGSTFTVMSMTHRSTSPPNPPPPSLPPPSSPAWKTSGAG